MGSGARSMATTINPIPDADSYKNADLSWVGKTKMDLCARDITYTSTQDSALPEIHNIMPFCTFKVDGMGCPSYAPSFLSFPKGSGPVLPQDNMYTATTWLDNSGFCCSLTSQLTVETTKVNLDHLDHDFTMSDFQVIKWPYADCPEFEFPVMDLTVYNVSYTNSKVYPFENADMELTMCNYKRPGGGTSNKLDYDKLAKSMNLEVGEDSEHSKREIGGLILQPGNSGMVVIGQNEDLYNAYDATNES